jgi:hypothetical protein
MVKHGGLAMKHGNSPMNKCITVDYVCVYIYMYGTPTYCLGTQQGWSTRVGPGNFTSTIGKTKQK